MKKKLASCCLLLALVPLLLSCGSSDDGDGSLTQVYDGGGAVQHTPEKSIETADDPTLQAPASVVIESEPGPSDSPNESTFLPSVDGQGSQATNGQSQIYEASDGSFSVPIPANWRVEESEGFVTLEAPEGDISVHIVVLDSDSPVEAIRSAWQIIDPEFSRHINEVNDVPGTVVGGVDEYIIVDYEWDQGNQPIIQTEGRLYNGRVHFLNYVMTLEAAQQRSSQIQIISSGYDIKELETKDLSGVKALPFSNELATEFEAFIIEKMEQMDVPGASVAIVQDGQIVYASGFGVASRESGEAVTPETLMLIGSTTKSITTMLMAQLVDEGVIDWDTRAVDLLPTFAVSDPDVTNQITIRNLVCACTGVPRRDLEWMFVSDELTAESIIESLREFEFFTGFGEAFQYSNQMVAAGGYLAAIAAGGKYGNLQDAYTVLLEERILEPIGMDSSTFSIDEVTRSGNFASPHGRTLTGEIVEIPLSYEASLAPMAPAGALWSNVLDMSNYLITELGSGIAPSGERVVSRENLAVTWEPQVEISADASYGLGWIIEDMDGLEKISHAGNTFGFSSELAFAPAANLGISVLSNQQSSLFNPLVTAWLFEKLLQQEPEVEELFQYLLDETEESLSFVRQGLVHRIDAASVEEYLGSYENDEIGTALLHIEDDRLFFDVADYRFEIRAVRASGDILYRIYSPPLAGLHVKFAQGADGNPEMILGQGVFAYTYHKTG